MIDDDQVTKYEKNCFTRAYELSTNYDIPPTILGLRFFLVGIFDNDLAAGELSYN